MQTLSFIALAVVLYVIMTEVLASIQFGPLIKDKELIPFLEKHREEYVESHTSDTAMFGPTYLPYIAKLPLSPIFKWYLSMPMHLNIGRVPRWSKAHKMLNTMHKEAYKPKKPIKIKISDI